MQLEPQDKPEICSSHSVSFSTPVQKFADVSVLDLRGRVFVCVCARGGGSFKHFVRKVDYRFAVDDANVEYVSQVSSWHPGLLCIMATPQQILAVELCEMITRFLFVSVLVLPGGDRCGS